VILQRFKFVLNFVFNTAMNLTVDINE
jgi:hypothetical protein